MLRHETGHWWALTVFESGLIMLMMIITWFGPEAKNRDLLNSRENNT